MAADLTEAVYQRLVSDPLVVALVSRYAGVPAVFTSKPIPGDAEFPWVISEGSGSPGSFSTDALAGDRQARDIFVFDEDLGSSVRADLIAARISALFTWSSGVVEGFVDWYAKGSVVVVRHAQSRQQDQGVIERMIRVELYKSTITGGTIGFEDYEEPSESVDGGRVSFSTTRTFIAGSLQVEMNSVRQRPGIDFVEDSDLHGYTFVEAPPAGMLLWHSYRY